MYSTTVAEIQFKAFTKSSVISCPQHSSLVLDPVLGTDVINDPQDALAFCFVENIHIPITLAGHISYFDQKTGGTISF